MTACTEPLTTVEAGRALIDALDDELLELLERRRRVSLQIQHLRVAAGGSRVQHRREVEIVNRYADRLARPGAALAIAVLEYCRGA